jgi:predicted GNAT family acetyltransferase
MTHKPISETAGSEPDVAHSPHRHRYEISVDNDLAGFAEYLDNGDQRIFYHTEIGESFTGRGLASTLIHSALSDTRALDKRVIPVCPFVAGYVRKHHDFDDGIDPVTPAVMAAVSAAPK